MKIKVFQHKDLKINYADDLPKVVDFFKSKGIDVEFTTPQVTYLALQNCPANLYYLNDNGHQDVLMYIFDRSQRAYSYALNFSKTLQVIEVSTATFDDAVDYTWKLIAHELMHTFFHRLRNQNIFLDDPMDLMNGIPYYKNENPYATDGNFAEAFKRLAPYLKPIVVLTRKKDTGKETLGELTYGTFKCKTLERPWKNNQPNISCIPKGDYEVRYSFSPKFMKYTYEILKVPNRSGIRIHSGNFFYEIQGCILLGSGYENLNNDEEVDVVNSKLTISAFEKLLAKRGFTLRIK